MFDINFPEWDRELFLFLNSKNIPWLDPIMVVLSSYTAWIVVCIVVLGIMIYKDRGRGKVAGIFLIIGVAAALILNNIIKLFIMRPRPGNEDLLQGLFNQLEEAGISYSFFSAHSSSSLCLATFTALYFKNKIYTFAIYAWALAVAYSRIYVGKHYPLDVLVGILFGLLMGWISYKLYSRYQSNKDLRKLNETF